MAKIRSHAFRGVKYLVCIEHIHGYADIPGREPPAIYLDDYDPPYSFLETAVHEAMHCEDHKITERVIDRRAKSMARWLWRLGYRRSEK